MAQCSSEEYACKTGNVEAAYFREHIQHVLPVRMVQPDGAPDHVHLPVQPF